MKNTSLCIILKMWEWAGSSREGNFVVGEVLWPLKSWNLQADIEVQVTSEKKQI